MLGVMTIRKDELKFREFDRYRGFYCGLCHAIGKRCGGACRMALSFEMTFMAMLLTSLYEPQTSQDMRRCAFHPVHKRLMLGNGITLAIKAAIIKLAMNCTNFEFH